MSKKLGFFGFVVVVVHHMISITYRVTDALAKFWHPAQETTVALTFLSALQTSRVHPLHDTRRLSMNQFLSTVVVDLYRS